MMEAIEKQPDGTLQLRKRSLNLDEIMSLPSKALLIDQVYQELVMESDVDKIKRLYNPRPEDIPAFLSALPTYPAKRFDISTLLDHFLYSKDFLSCKHEPFPTPFNSYLHNDDGQTVPEEQPPLQPVDHLGFGVRGVYERHQQFI